MAFVGDRRATKEPTLVCLPTKKSWEWCMGNAINSYDKLEEYHTNVADQGPLWTPGDNEGIPKAIKIPNLLAIPNALVNLLLTQGPSITPYDVLATVDGFVESSRHPHGQQWEFIWQWCLVVGQAGLNRKSKVFLRTIPVKSTRRSLTIGWGKSLISL
jgi:hypothetical protein